MVGTPTEKVDELSCRGIRAWQAQVEMGRHIRIPATNNLAQEIENKLYENGPEKYTSLLIDYLMCLSTCNQPQTTVKSP
jgi:hypothetical protein